jgi:hypothetical protein
MLGNWLNQYAEDFIQLPEVPCLKQLVVYLHLNRPGSDEEYQAQLLIFLENLQLSEV